MSKLSPVHGWSVVFAFVVLAASMAGQTGCGSPVATKQLGTREPAVEGAKVANQPQQKDTEKNSAANQDNEPETSNDKPSASDDKPSGSNENAVASDDKTQQDNDQKQQGVAEKEPGGGDGEGVDNDDNKVDELSKHPFIHRIRVPDFPKDLDWLNTSGPLRSADLKGKYVVLDFWTYCCINCLHILPELKKLEAAYPNELVVIGVHSAKFETEKDTKNINEAILRYEIKHPVINDSDHRVWNMYGVRSWPTVLMIDPEGNAVWGAGGEVEFETLDKLIKESLPYYRKRGALDETPVHFDLLEHRQAATALRFPGKVLADEPGNRLFISDSNHNRIVITTLAGELVDTIGAGTIGRADGGYDEATFDHPQGTAIVGETLYVADTENHLIRKIDLAAKSVQTIAGVGTQGRNAWPGLNQLGPVDELPDRFVGKPLETGLNSPWALWVHEKNLYIAMAGPHQIWKMPLDESEIGPYAGNGREDIVDGPLLPKTPYDLGISSFAQPSGLTSDGTWLYVADSEGSSIRAVPFDPTKEVRTVVGTSELPGGRLFAFGDVDGKQALSTFAKTASGAFRRDENGEVIIEGVRLQHALGVVYHDGNIYVADTYNNKIKVVNAKTGETKTIAGTGESGRADEPAMFDEPAGITYAKGRLYIADTNNHAIRTFELATKKTETLAIAGLEPPKPATEPKKPTFPGAKKVNVAEQLVKAVDGKVTVAVQLSLPKGWKINELAPMAYLLEADGDAGPIRRDALQPKLTRVEKPSLEFEVAVPINGAGQDTVRISLNYFYCQEGSEGLCKVGSIVWNVPIVVNDSAKTNTAVVKHAIAP